MATSKSTLVTNLEATTQTIMDRRDAGVLKTVVDVHEVATTEIDNTDDTILLAPIPSHARILDVQIMNDDLDSNACPTLAANIGLFYSGIGGTQTKDGNTSGTVIDADAFASAVTTLQAATTTWQGLRTEADDIADVDNEAWSVGGLSADPGGWFYIGVSPSTAAATAQAGTLVVRVTYVA